MKIQNPLRALSAAALPVMLLALSGCATPHNITYFQDMPIEQEVHTIKPVPVTIKTGDELSILVSARDAALSSLFSLYSNYDVASASGGGGYSNYQRTSLYVVGEDGCIDFPVLGRIPVAGQSREELQLSIKHMIQEQNLIKDPVVTVTLENLYVTTIGATGVGRVNIDRDNFTLLDAISQKGDLQMGGMRENVRVIRQTGLDTRIMYEVNLCSAEDLYNSPAYYLQQGDVIYVEPSNKLKRTTTEYGSQMMQYTFWMGILTSALTIVAIFRR